MSVADPSIASVPSGIVNDDSPDRDISSPPRKRIGQRLRQRAMNTLRRTSSVASVPRAEGGGIPGLFVGAELSGTAANQPALIDLVPASKKSWVLKRLEER